jgi:hypothetical protein
MPAPSAGMTGKQNRGVRHSENVEKLISYDRIIRICQTIGGALFEN